MGRHQVVIQNKKSLLLFLLLLLVALMVLVVLVVLVTVVQKDLTYVNMEEDVTLVKNVVAKEFVHMGDNGINVKIAVVVEYVDMQESEVNAKIAVVVPSVDTNAYVQNAKNVVVSVILYLHLIRKQVSAAVPTLVLAVAVPVVLLKKENLKL